MNLIRTRLCVGTLFGQRCQQLPQRWTRRGTSNKLQEVKAEPPPAVPAQAAPRPAFKLPGYRPSPLDKKILLWSGRFKTPEQIPDLVSYETLDAARNKIRVKACYAMMAVTIGACLIMVLLGKQAAGRHESLTGQNMEKKAKWKEELQKQKEAALALSDKAQ